MRTAIGIEDSAPDASSFEALAEMSAIHHAVLFAPPGGLGHSLGFSGLLLCLACGFGSSLKSREAPAGKKVPLVLVAPSAGAPELLGFPTSLDLPDLGEFPLVG